MGLQAGTALPPARRLVILKVDGLNGDLLYRTMRQIDPHTGKSLLPWFSHIFAQSGVIFENFYTRGISLSAPSWSMLDTGRHSIIRGNVEYDRYTGHVYDYLNFFPFYLGYARSRQVDMPGVQVLDRAGIPLLIDSFPYAQRFQSFQLFQRGVRWPTLEHALARRFSSKVLFSMLENAGTPSLDETLEEETDLELKHALSEPEIFYADFFTGDVDHIGHATSNPAALLDTLQQVDALAGRIWMAIQASALRNSTLFVVISDHGMNSVPGVISQTFSLPDLFNSAEGGAHHVVTNRVLMSDYKLRGLNPLTDRVFTPSTVSFYLAGEASRYPTAWLDIDGNERAAVYLRQSDLNKIHILLLQLARPNLPPQLRHAVARCVRETIDKHQSAWQKEADELEQEMTALDEAIHRRAELVRAQPQSWSREQRDAGEDKVARRLSDELRDWQREHAEYTTYVKRLRALLNLRLESDRPFRVNIAEFVPPLALGDNNTIFDLENYVAGPSARGLVLDSAGKLDEEQSFRHIDYFPLLASQRVRNNPQVALSSRPIDFIMMPLRGDAKQRYWLYSSEDDQLLIDVDDSTRIELEPIRHLKQDADGVIHWDPQPWRPGLPLRLFEDPELRLLPDADRAQWLSGWHTEREWLEAIDRCEYSNGVIGVIEELSPVADNVPGPSGMAPLLVRYERRRRELVEADFHILAANHWNFNVRFPNPGGNHGSFFRISTHSVWMMAGAGLPTRVVETPYDSLNFASTVLSLLGRTPPMPNRVVFVQR